MNKGNISYNELLQKNNINWECKVQEISNKPFCYYTSVETLNEILNGGYIYLNSLRNMNDVSEYNLHKEKADDIFVFCLCNCKPEKIAMWYLYGGILGNGARMQFTTGALKELHNSITYLYEVEDNRVVEDNPLIIGRDFELQNGWVYYQKKDSPHQIKYRGNAYIIDDDKLFGQENYFIKDKPWEYEKEFRFVFINKTHQKFEKIAIPIKNFDYAKKVKIRFAPEADEKIRAKTIEMEGFRKYYLNQIEKSKLDIKMNLLNRNKNVVLENIHTVFDDCNDCDLTRLCTEIGKRGKCGKQNTEEKEA